MSWNNTTGEKGEALAVIYLEQNGYMILHRNWRIKHWEVDIIASRHNRLHFFEIKTRTTGKYGKPEESISKEKMNNMRNAAEEFQYMHPEWKYVQFDALAITMAYQKPIEYFLIEDIYF